MSIDLDNAELVSIGEAAKVLGTTELNVLMHIKRGLLKGTEGPEGGWQVNAASLAALRAQGASTKGQVVCATSHCGKGGCSSCK